MSDALAIEIVRSLPSTIAATAGILAYFKAGAAKRAADATHKIVNSQMDEYKELVGRASKAEGNLEGRADLKAEQDESSSK